MEKFLALLCIVLAVILVACAAELETVEETPAVAVVATLEPPTNIPIPLTDTPLPPTDTPLPPTDTPLPPTDTPLPPTDTPLPPTDTPTPMPTATYGPTPCDEVDGACLFLHFDGEICTYVGPNDLKSGPVTVVYHNESQGGSLVALFIIEDDKTIDDVIEYQGEEPNTGHAPSWTEMIFRGNTPASEIYTWEGLLDEGTHILVCSRIIPHGVWLGGGFTVED